MSPDLADFKLNAGDIAPRYWHLHALYESPLVIAAHLSRDRAEFFEDDARESLLTWLSKVEQTARFVNGARPVVACLEEIDEGHLGRMARWENDANWRGSGCVLYVEESEVKARDRLEQLLFRSVGEAHLDASDASDLVLAADRITHMLGRLSNPASRALAEGIRDVLEQRQRQSGLQKDLQEDLKTQVTVLVRSWRLNPIVQLDAAAASPIKLDQTTRPPSSDLGERERLGRLVSVRVSRFRGWCGKDEHEVNIDADLVLLAGPNGHGKSTFLEALILGVCGHIPRGGDGIGPRHMSSGASSVRIQPKASDSLRAELPSQTQMLSEDKEGRLAELSLPKLARSRLWHDFYNAVGNAQSASKAEASLCSVFADQLYERFDYSKSADSLLGAFSIPGKQLSTVREALDDARKMLNSEIQDRGARISRLRDPRNEVTTRAALLAAFEAAQPIYQDFAELYGHYETGKSLPLWPVLSDLEIAIGPVQAALDDLTRALGVNAETLPKTVRDSIKHWKESELLDAQQDRRDLDDLMHRRADLEAKYPGARLRVDLFAGADGDPPLDVCLASLARNQNTWLRASVRFGLTEVAEQLERVIPDALKRLSEQTDWHVSRWRKVAEEMEGLDKEIEEVRKHVKETERFRKLRIVERSTELDRLWNALHDRKAFESSDAMVSQLEEEQRRADEARQAVDELIDKLEPLELHPALRKEFERVLNDVLGRIQLCPGILPAKVQSDGKILMHDDRTINDLSTGQKTQLAVALSVGVNLALSSRLGNSMLAMDDATAAYDVSNIAREATFWRATAYGHVARNLPDGGDPQQRQVFLSSHNEATTRRLIELLRPPKGATMKVVRFLSWSPERGPEYRIHDVRCAAESCLETRQRLTRELTSSLGRNR